MPLCYDVGMGKSADEKKIGYIVACVSEFARSTDLDVREAFRYLYNNGGITFLVECYDAEHTLSFEEAVEDLKRVAQQAGGQIV
jgi:hypothetical protein